MPRHSRRFRLPPAPTLAAAVALVSSVAGAARAYEGLASLDLAAGYSHLSERGPLPSMGGELALGGSYGLGDAFTARASLGYGLQVGRAESDSTARARLELAYLLDVVAVVPFFGVGTSAWILPRQGWDVAPGAHGLVGVDLLLTREWNVGLDLRLGVLFNTPARVANFESQLRLSRMFELPY